MPSNTKEVPRLTLFYKELGHGGPGNRVLPSHSLNLSDSTTARLRDSTKNTAKGDLSNQETQTPEIKDLKEEVWDLKAVNLAKRTESESMKRTLRWTEKKLLKLQRLTESYNPPKGFSFFHFPEAARSSEAREPPAAGDWRRKREVQEVPACRDRPSPTVPSQGTPPLCHQPTPQPMLSLLQLDSQAHVSPDPGPERRPRTRGIVSLEVR